MRFAWVVGLILLAGCTSTKGGEKDSTRLRYSGDGLDYAMSRPNGERPSGITADLTLVDLDAALAEELLYIDGHTDISPRAFKNPMGEIAAVNAVYGHGRLLARETMAISPGTPALWEWRVEQPYLQDWEVKQTRNGETLSPIFNSVRDAVKCELEMKRDGDGINLVMRTTSSHLAQPIEGISITLDAGNPALIEVPELTVVERIGSESLAPEETAMFQLSRASAEEGERVRLLFVRVVETGE